MYRRLLGEAIGCGRAEITYLIFPTKRIYVLDCWHEPKVERDSVAGLSFISVDYKDEKKFPAGDRFACSKTNCDELK